MSVLPVAAGQVSEIQKKAGEPDGSPAAVPFEEFLSGKAGPSGDQPVSAATAAEVLRLKMLSSALSLGSDQPPAAGTQSQAVQGLLNKFLEQLPKRADGLPASPDATTAAAAAPQTVSDDNLGPNPTISAIIDKASKRYGVDAALIRAVIKQESNFNPRAVSSAGAQGLMQLMPSTARGLGVSDSFDPEQNVMAGTRFLKDMLQRYGGDLDQTLAAYNWGPGNVDRHGTASLPRETRDYLVKVKGYYAQNVA